MITAARRFNFGNEKKNYPKLVRTDQTIEDGTMPTTRATIFNKGFRQDLDIFIFRMRQQTTPNTQRLKHRMFSIMRHLRRKHFAFIIFSSPSSCLHSLLWFVCTLGNRMQSGILTMLYRRTSIQYIHNLYTRFII